MNRIGPPKVDRHKVDALLLGNRTIPNRQTLADKIGISDRTLTRLTTGEGSWAHAETLANILEVPIESLLESPLWSTPPWSSRLPEPLIRLISTAHREEMRGNPWLAAEEFERAARAARELPHSTRKVRTIEQINFRISLNHEWARRLRLLKERSVESTRIQLLDDDGNVVGEKSKLEAHRDGN